MGSESSASIHSDPTIVVSHKLTLPNLDDPKQQWRVMVVVRESSAAPERIAEVVGDTVRVWYQSARQIVKRVKVGDGKPRERKLPAPRHDKSIVTVFGDLLPGGDSFTVTEETSVSDALALYWSVSDELTALRNKLIEKLPADYASVPSMDNAPAPAAQQQQATVPNGVTISNGFPNKKRRQFQNGQMVGWIVDKIEIGVQNSTKVFKLWRGNGQYPLFTVFADNEREMTVAGTLLNGLGLSLEKPIVTGKWTLVTRVSHGEKDGALLEYFNFESFTQG